MSTHSTAIADTGHDDAALVSQSLAGDRDAFGQIVARYQSLVCGLAYSATGSRSHSEDLAQETFVAAWRSLRDLRDPGRLCAWLCGIARNVIRGDRRKLVRDPAFAADAFDASLELASTDPLPTAQAVSNEEMAILWREVGRLPATYREPLILFYRDHESVERVAAALELTPDAVMQRLTRGRRALQAQMMRFVETTLARTNPGPQFALHVQAALPLLAGAGPAAALGTAAKSGAAAKGNLFGCLAAWAAPLVGLFAAMGMSWAELRNATTTRERRFVARYLLALWLSAAGFVVALPIVSRFADSAGLYARRDWTVTAPMVGVWFGFAMIALTLVVLMIRGRTELRRQIAAEAPVPLSPQMPPSWAKRIGVTAGFLTSLFWVLIFVAWQAGDRAFVGGLVGGVVLLGAIPLWLGRNQRDLLHATSYSVWYVAFCGLIFLAILNWRLDVWLAALFRVDAPTMQQLLPMSIIHWLSSIAVVWTIVLVLVTRPNHKP